MNEQDNRPRCEHLVVYPMENCTVCMKAEIERLQYELRVIGDMAVVDWNAAVVGRVDAVVSGSSRTYSQARRAELAQYETMKAEIAELKAKLEVYKDIESAYGLQAMELRQAKEQLAEFEKVKP